MHLGPLGDMAAVSGGSRICAPSQLRRHFPLSDTAQDATITEAGHTPLRCSMPGPRIRGV